MQPIERSVSTKMGNMDSLNPKSVVERWVRAFNNADVETLASFYGRDAVNHQVAERPVEGKEAIRTNV